MEHFEKHGAALRPDRQMEAFREALEDCQLSDLGFIGSKFTWYNNREDEYFTKAWLDRVVTNPDWCEKFGETYVFVLAARSSDHCPFFSFFFSLILEIMGLKTPIRLRLLNSKPTGWSMMHVLQELKMLGKIGFLRGTHLTFS
jgi:hypothetical protein